MKIQTVQTGTVFFFPEILVQESPQHRLHTVLAIILANKVLGGQVTSISASSINSAASAINEGFDAGGVMVSGGTCTTTASTSSELEAPVQLLGQQVTLTATPNPFSDKLRFSIQSPISGQGSLEVYNMLGQKVKTLYQGYIQAGRGQVIEYNVPEVHRTNLIYRLQVGDQQVTGKLINLK